VVAAERKEKHFFFLDVVVVDFSNNKE